MFDCLIKHLDCWQYHRFSSRNFSRDSEERLFSLKENGTRHASSLRETYNSLYVHFAGKVIK